jgi:ATP-dependent exoDNAse (exonuclease V) alpha subunit
VEQKILDKKLPSTLTEGQRNFVEHVLTTKDFLSVIQGDAGTGKTFAVTQIREILEKENSPVSIVGLGFTGKAAQELAAAAKIETSTIASFLLSKKPIENKIIIVDEASMVSSNDMLNLINKAATGGNKIVLVGDRKQLQAIGAGKMFTELQRERVINEVNMQEVLRQKTDETKELVKNIKEYQTGDNTDGMKDAFALMDKHGIIEEVVSKSKNENVTKQFIQSKAIEEYLKSDDCLILTASREEKSNINIRVRQRILSEEQLNNSVTILAKESLQNSYIATDYKVGDKVVKSGKEYTVTGIVQKENALVLGRTNNGKEEKAAAKLYEERVTASREKQLVLSPGEKIIFTKNDRKLGVQNGLSGIIESIDKDKNITIQLKDRKVTFNTNRYSNLDYGYALTLHKAQGQTCEKAIFVHSAGDNVSTESFYVAATRATHNVKVLTPNKDALFNSVCKAQDKTSTREFVHNVQRVQNVHSIQNKNVHVTKAANVKTKNRSIGVRP